jgi:hypothetical protein
MKQTARVQRAMAEEAKQRLARFDRVEVWQGLVPGDPVRISGHRGRTWLFQAFVTNTSNGASWVEVHELVVARGEAGAEAGGGRREADEGGDPGKRTFARPRSFRPELVVPVRKRKRHRRAAPEPAAPPAPALAGEPCPAVELEMVDPVDPLRGVQASVFD